MDMKLNREFVFVYSGEIDEGIVKDILRLNGYRNCSVTEYCRTITISVQGLEGLSHLIAVCTDEDKEGPSLKFSGSLQRAIVAFIG